jgi:hypothetical protein
VPDLGDPGSPVALPDSTKLLWLHHLSGMEVLCHGRTRSHSHTEEADELPGASESNVWGRMLWFE